MGDRLRSLVGILLFLALAYAFCPRDRRRAISWRCVGWGLAIEAVVALLVFRLRGSEQYFTWARDLVNGLLAHATEGGRMVFGVLGDGRALGAYFGGDSFILALQSLIPVIVFFAALMAVLYQMGVMQRVVAFCARIMMRLMGTSGAETLSAVGNVFLGMTEAPLMIRPYLERLTRSELFCVMVGGLANSAGTVLAVYVLVLQDQFPTIAGHLLTASVLSAPVGLVVAKLMLPESDVPETAGRADAFAEKAYTNLLDALTGGAAEGLKLALNVIAMLIAAVALIHLLNAGLAYPAKWHNQAMLAAVARTAGVDLAAPPDSWPATEDAAAVAALAAEHGVDAVAWRPLSCQRLGGWLFWPMAWCLGVPADDVADCAQLLSLKTVLNELVAYTHMGDWLRAEPTRLSERGRVIISYALCGFASFGSIAITIGGLGGLVPTRRRELAELGLLSLVGGTLTSCLCACTAGLLMP